MISNHKVWLKAAAIGLVAVVISTLGIQASDELSGMSGRLSGLVLDSQSGCRTHETLLLFGTHSLCMDTYEVGPGDSCPLSEINGEVDTQLNVASSACVPTTEPEVVPWRYVTYTQAQQLCARAGKRLPTNEEWYKVALGQLDTEACFMESGGALKRTGDNNCVTNTGVNDLVGNVWEWVSDTTNSGQYNGRALPTPGYVTLVDAEGVVLETRTVPDKSFGEDYAWVSDSGVQGIIRGGFYGSGTDGGIFSQNLAVPLNFSAVGVGFRCVRDLL